MRRLTITVLLCLWAVFVFANGDGPRSSLSTPAGMKITPKPEGRGAEVEPQAMDSAPWATGSLEMEYTIGGPGQDAVPTRFLVRCTMVGKSPLPEKPVDVPPGQGPSVYRAAILLSALVPQPTANTAYECTQAPWNQQIGEGPASAPYPFVVIPASFASTATMRLKK